MSPDMVMSLSFQFKFFVINDWLQKVADLGCLQKVADLGSTIKQSTIKQFLVFTF